MKLLFVSPYAPTRIRTRPYNLVRALARRGHTLTLGTVWENEAERDALRTLQEEGIRVIAVPLTRRQQGLNLARALASPQPLQSLYCWQPELARAIAAEVLSGTQVAHVEHLRGAQYGLALRPALPVVWDSVDCLSYLFEQSARTSRTLFGRMVARWELPRTRAHEARLVKSFSRVLVTSAQDKRALLALDPQGSAERGEALHILPNGVDLDYFAPREGARQPQTLVMTGKLSYHANVTAALYLVQQVMPLVWAHMPAVRIVIVGHRPPPQVLALAQADSDHIQVIGSVADLRPYLAEATVAIAPILYGAGIQNKVLEAMAMGTPVVATSQAVSALAVSHEDQVLIAEDNRGLASQVLRLLKDAALRERIGRQGRRYVERYHDWKQVVERLEEIYDEAIAERALALA